MPRAVCKRGSARDGDRSELLLQHLHNGTVQPFSSRSEHRLRFEEDAVIEDLEMVCGKRSARRRDVDDHLGYYGSRRPFGRTGALDNEIAAVALLGEEVARKVIGIK